MLALKPNQLDALRQNRLRQLAARLAADAPDLGSRDSFLRYIREGEDAGVTTERDLAEFAFMLATVDRQGRPTLVQELLSNPEVSGDLKIFQIGHALRGGQA